MSDSNLNRPIHGGRIGEDRVMGVAQTIASMATDSAANACGQVPEDDGRIGAHALQLAAQAWCEPDTSNRVMDPALCYSFARILERELRKPWLGNATTRQLLEEVRTRTEIDGTASYRTVGRR